MLDIVVPITTIKARETWVRIQSDQAFSAPSQVPLILIAFGEKTEFSDIVCLQFFYKSCKIYWIKVKEIPSSLRRLSLLGFFWPSVTIFAALCQNCPVFSLFALNKKIAPVYWRENQMAARGLHIQKFVILAPTLCCNILTISSRGKLAFNTFIKYPFQVGKYHRP